MREVKPTQEPVPSSNIKDLFFNSGLLDIWATSLEPKYIDRFGNCHLTAAGMEWLFKELVEKFKVDMNIAIVAAGYITIDSFQQGADLPSNELTQRNHVLRDEATGEYYRWDGDLPKQVLAGSTPQSTGGIGKGAWVSVDDASFRSDFNEISQSIQLSYESVSSMKESVPTRGIKAARVGDLISCTTFHEDYVLPSPNIYVVTTETANEFDIIDIGNGLSAKLTNLSEGYLIERLGAKPDLHINGVINPNPTDNYPIFDHAIKKGVSFILSGSYFSSQTLDFTNENTNKKFSVKG
ncbi:hypothetical protein ACUU3R_004112, partial [Providencia rettgeri]